MNRIASMPRPYLFPGFRFHPTDEELIVCYMKKKVASPSNAPLSIIANIDLYKFNPWELPGRAMFGENEWFFFSPRDRKYPNGARPNRAAVSGYWKATGTDKPILSSYGSKCVGVKKALVFYRGRPPKGVKTEWMMYEYKLLDDRRLSTRLRGSMRLDDWVLCRVRQKSNGQFPRRENQEESNHKSFPQTELGGFEERDIIEKMNYLIDSQQVHQEGEVVDAHQQPSLDHFQGGLSGQIFFGMNSNTQIQSHPIFSMKTALQTIKRVLSVGAINELLVPISPNRRPSSLLNLDKSSLFEIS
ncbi:hypothetical protein NMG60_11012779 [Bertholletia excelsa]